MENFKLVSSEESKKSGGRWFAGYIVAGLIFSFGQSFNKSSIDDLVIIVFAIGAGFSYHWLKRKIKIKNEAGKSILTFFILFILSALLIGFFTAISTALV